MPVAKKLISAEYNLPAAAEFHDPDLHNLQSDEQKSAYLHSLFGQSQIGSLSLNIVSDKAELRWVLPNVVEEAETLHKEALGHARDKDFQKAVEVWVKAIAQNPDDPDYYFNTGIAFFELKNYTEAIENLQQALTICPIYYKARLILGTIYFKSRKFEEAESHLRLSIGFNPGNALALLNLAAALSVLKKYDEGIAVFNKVVELNPGEARAHFGLGKIFGIQGNIRDANNCFKKVIELDTKGTLANHAKRAIIADPASSTLDLQGLAEKQDAAIDPKNLEEAYSEAYKLYLYGDYVQAVTIYKKYLELKPDDDYVWFSLGEAWLRSGKPLEAIQSFTKAIKIKSSKALYFKQLAVAFDFAGHPDKALKSIVKAEQLGKNDSMTYTILGKALYKCGRYDESVVRLQEALKRNKFNISAQYYLANALLKLNRADEAAEHLLWIVNTKSKTPLKMKAEKLLDAIPG